MTAKRPTRAVVAAFAVALTCFALAGFALAAAPTSFEGPGWTGITHPLAVIHARQELMEHIELLMEPIDTITVSEVRNVDQLRVNAEAVSAMLLALPHLFPPTTNRYDPKLLEPVTIALPAIWKNFDSFQALATAASQAAERMAEAKGDAGLRDASRTLRASCDACHKLYLRAYEPPKVLDSDRNFDFDAALRRK